MVLVIHSFLVCLCIPEDIFLCFTRRMTYDYASEIRGTAAVVELDPHLELKHIGIWD